VAEELKEILASEILDKIQKGEPLEYDNVIIKGNLDVSKLNLPKGNGKFLVTSRIKITNLRIEGSVIFGDTIFKEAINFEGVTFCGDANFSGAEFSGSANFNEATFRGITDFNGAKFGEGAGFVDAAFRWVAYFNGTRFIRFANFDGAAFSDDIRFVEAIFWGDANFSGAKFSGSSNFNDAAFRGMAEFRGAAFGGDIWFVEAKFWGNANFSGAKFSGSSNFNDVAFRGMAEFRGAAFGGSADFGHTESIEIEYPKDCSIAFDLRTDVGAERRHPELRDIFYNYQSKSISKIIEEEWEEASKGIVLFNCPKQMKQGETERVESRISQALNERIRIGLKGKGVPDFKEIKIFSIMSAELHNREFNIKELSPRVQITQVDEYTQWSWEITPLKNGKHILNLSISAIIPIPGTDNLQKQLPLLEWPVEVNINRTYIIRNFLGANWQWLISFVIGTLFGSGVYLWILEHRLG
jgi:uncharacterized protein YjbI with pentapeptide repeats